MKFYEFWVNYPHGNYSVVVLAENLDQAKVLAFSEFKIICSDELNIELLVPANIFEKPACLIYFDGEE